MPGAHSSTRRHGRRQALDRFHDHDDDEDAVSSSGAVSESSSRASSASDDDGLASKLPTLPDLRFEQSYLATIRGFLHEEHPSRDSVDDEGNVEKDHHHKVTVTHSKVKHEHELWLGNLRVEWFPILYVTVRDQLLSPLVQGAVWGLGGLLLTQIRQYVSARTRGAPKVGGVQRTTSSILRSVGLGKR